MVLRVWQFRGTIINHDDLTIGINKHCIDSSFASKAFEVKVDIDPLSRLTLLGDSTVDSKVALTLS
jgi:hypothetical protein